jgi:hypothetical protein
VKTLGASGVASGMVSTITVVVLVIVVSFFCGLSWPRLENSRQADNTSPPDHFAMLVRYLCSFNRKEYVPIAMII